MYKIFTLALVLQLCCFSSVQGDPIAPQATMGRDERINEVVVRVEAYLIQQGSSFEALSNQGGTLEFGGLDADFAVARWPESMGFAAPSAQNLPELGAATLLVDAARVTNRLERLQESLPVYLQKKPPDRDNPLSPLGLSYARLAMFLDAEGLTNALSGNVVSPSELINTITSWDKLDINSRDAKYMEYLRLKAQLEALGGDIQSLKFLGVYPAIESPDPTPLEPTGKEY